MSPLFAESKKPVKPYGRMYEENIFENIGSLYKLRGHILAHIIKKTT